MSRIGTREVLASVSLSWIIASAISAYPYWLYGVAPTFTDAYFESMSGFTTTGATIFPRLDDLPGGILTWRAITHWLGGMGIIGLTLAVMPMIGGGFQMFSAESPGMTHEKMTPRLRQTAIYLWLIYLGLTAALTLSLFFGGMSFFDAVNHSMAAISTGGFSTHSSSVAFYNNSYFEWVLTLFMFLSGANFVLHFHAVKGRTLRRYFADPEFRVYAGSMLTLTLFASADLFIEGGYASFADALRVGAFHVTSFVTTTGFVAANYDAWPQFAKAILFICLFIGGCAGSTAGGIKHVRFLVMFKNVGRQISKTLNPKSVVMFPIGSSTLDPAVMSSCMAFFGLYFIVFVGGAFATSLVEPDLITALSGAASALGNVGPAFGNLGAADNFSRQAQAAKWIYSFLMLCGRLELYTVFALFSGVFWREGRMSVNGAD
jgi:trk system potassium uptake protein TrkH